jgi:hypothetical protein
VKPRQQVLQQKLPDFWSRCLKAMCDFCKVTETRTKWWDAAYNNPAKIKHTPNAKAYLSSSSFANILKRNRSLQSSRD